MNKHAILIMAHNNLWTLRELIKTFDSKYFDIYVHLDLKSFIEEKDLTNLCKFSRVKVVKKIDIRWAHYSQIECELLLINEAIKNYNYSYYHLISGVDIPIKSNKTLYEFFENSKKEFIHFESDKLPRKKNSYYHMYNIGMRNYRKGNLYKILNKFCLCVQKILFIRINKNIEFYTGANWFSITDNCAKYVLSKEKEIEKIYKYSRSGDESFLQTIVYNSKYKDNLYNLDFNDNYDSCKRYIDWNRGNPYVFKLNDYNELMNSSCFFARKFDEKIDKLIIEKVLKNRGK